MAAQFREQGVELAALRQSVDKRVLDAKLELQNRQVAACEHAPSLLSSRLAYNLACPR